MESERSNQPAGSQQLYLLNSTHVRQKLQRIPNLLSKEKDVVAAAYLAILSRPPTEDEIKIVEKHAESYKALDKLPPKGAKKALPAKLPPEVLADLVWALVNSEEFLYRH
jgi:hypothetical protein